MVGHSHAVYDTGSRFAINPATRTISNNSDGKVVLVQYDHNSEEITFEIPRYVDGHDMALSTVAQVHYDNGGSKGRYDADDLKVSDGNEEKVTFTWLVSQNATMNHGKLSFIVKFRCYDGDKVVYEWNTAMYEGINVKEGKNYDGEVVIESADAIEALRIELTSTLDTAMSELNDKVEQSVSSEFDERTRTEVWKFVLDDGTTVDKLVFVP